MTSRHLSSKRAALPSEAGFANGTFDVEADVMNSFRNFWRMDMLAKGLLPRTDEFGCNQDK